MQNSGKTGGDDQSQRNNGRAERQFKIGTHQFFSF